MRKLAVSLVILSFLLLGLGIVIEGANSVAFSDGGWNHAGNLRLAKVMMIEGGVLFFSGVYAFFIRKPKS